VKNHIGDTNKKVCPFCGAKPRSGSTSWFKCGTLTDPKSPDREDQTVACIETEVGAFRKRIKQLETQVDEMMADNCYKETHE
jgi:hypothetical protein